MKITDQELRKIVREVVRKKVATLREGDDFTARRQVVHSAEAASMNFEQEIVKLLGLEHPDNLPEALQKRYYLVVDTMKDKIKSAVMEATRDLAAFPKPREHGGK